MCGSRAAAREVMSSGVTGASAVAEPTCLRHRISVGILHSLPSGLHRCRRFLRRVGHCGRPRTSTGHVADPPVAVSVVVQEDFGVTRTSKIGDPNGMLSIDQVAEAGTLTDQTPVKFPVGHAPQPPVAVPFVVEHHLRVPRPVKSAIQIGWFPAQFWHRIPASEATRGAALVL
jgi:hypothetical protein